MTTGRFTKYLFFLMMIIMITVLSWGMAIPWVFNIEHMIMIILLPITIMVTVWFQFVLARKLVLMLKQDIGA